MRRQDNKCYAFKMRGDGHTIEVRHKFMYIYRKGSVCHFCVCRQCESFQNIFMLALSSRISLHQFECASECICEMDKCASKVQLFVNCHIRFLIQNVCVRKVNAFYKL